MSKRIVSTLDETLLCAEKSLNTLDIQSEQLTNINSNLNDINNNLSYSEYLIKKIKSIFYNKYFFNETQYSEKKEIQKKSNTMEQNKQNIEDNLTSKLNILKQINLKISDVLDFQNNLVKNLDNKTDITDLEMNNINNKLNELI